jgi:translation initiation factor IF-2
VPVRIYAFAKELGLDNKQLLEICEKANIKGKGSALASLEDDEIAIVKGFMSGGDVAKPEPEPDVAAPMRPVRPAASKKKIGEIVSPVSIASPTVEEEVVEEEAVEEEVVEEEVVEEEVVEEEVVEEGVVEEGVVEEGVEALETSEPSEAPEEPAPTAKRGGLLDRIRGVKPKAKGEPVKPKVAAKAKRVEPKTPKTLKTPKTVAPMVKPPLMSRRPPGVAPRRALKNLDRSGDTKGDALKKDTPKKKPAGANVRLAAMPTVKQPQPRKETGEKVQKPDIALPQDAIKSVKSGGGVAPLEHLTSSKNKKKGKATDAVVEAEDAN